ncbi:MAG: hypothetical protein ACI9MC_003174 [Kiritimatiellia bacterium]|jgi:hypothetical protein
MRRTLILGLALAACNGANISGEVQGEPVRGARNAIFDQADVNIPLIGSQKWLLLIVTDLPDACRVYTELADNVEFTCEESCEDLGRIAQQDLGADDYWTLNLTIIADPARVDGTFTQASVPGSNQFSGTFTRWQTAHLYDEATCLQTCQDKGALPSDTTSVGGGTTLVDKYESNDTLNGSFDLVLDGDTIDGSFSAKPCPQLSDYVLWFPE